MGTLEGKVVSISDDGNIVTDIGADKFQGVPTDDKVTITCDGHVTAGIFPRDHDQPSMTLLALIGESGRLELALVDERASDFLGIRTGAPVIVKW